MGGRATIARIRTGYIGFRRVSSLCLDSHVGLMLGYRWPKKNTRCFSPNEFAVLRFLCPAFLRPLLGGEALRCLQPKKSLRIDFRAKLMLGNFWGDNG